MKKIMCLLLAVLMCYMLVSCGTNTVATSGDIVDEVSLEKETFKLIREANDCYSFLMDKMLDGWYFAVQHSSDDTAEEYEALWDLFMSHMYVIDDEQLDAALVYATGYSEEKINETHKTIKGMFLMKSEVAIRAAKYIIIDKNSPEYFDESRNKLDQAKENLKQMDTDSSAYQVLMDYYLMANEILNWTDSPEGSYNSSSSSLIDYENRADRYNAELEVILG